jgi:hypothetical protein
VTGPCAKAVVTCTLVLPDGRRFVGRNDCETPQAACPREPSEGYEKCRTICGQLGHAERRAVAASGFLAHGAHAYVEGNTYLCRACQEYLTASGVHTFTIGAPPRD